MKWAGITGCMLVVAVAPRSGRAEEPPPTTVWLPGSARAISRADSASRDAPVFEYAYGPRAQASLGIEPALFQLVRTRTTWRFGFFGFVGLENETSDRLFAPNELWRGAAGLSTFAELTGLERRWLPRGGHLEVGLVVGFEAAHQSAQSSAALPPPRSGDIPYGAGGDYLEPDIALEVPVRVASWVRFRLRDRLYFNELPLLVGAREASDVVADYFHEGLVNAPAIDVALRWRQGARVQPQLAAFADLLFPHDAFAAEGWFVRVMAGAVLPGRVGQVEPFASFDAGNGQGLLVNRREVRVSLGVRDALF